MRSAWLVFAAALLAGCDCTLSEGCDDTLFNKGGDTGPITGEGWDAVDQMFGQYCLNCHGAGSTFPDLETDACAAIVGVESVNYSPSLLVSASSSADSVIWHKMANDDSTAWGGVMPADGNTVDQALIDNLAEWIDDGALCGDEADTGTAGGGS